MTAPHRRPAPRLIAVAGGKGGVGKSTIAANLSAAIARSGHRVVLVDGDLGAANLHTMLGITKPTTGLADLLDGKVDTLDGARVAVGPGLHLVPGTSRPGAANLPARERVRLMRAILKLDADVIVLDIGAGTAFTAVDMVVMSDLKLFVITPQLPSIHNAYALLKACVHRLAYKLAADDLEKALVDAALGNDHKARTIDQLIATMRGFDDRFADRLVDLLARFGAGLVCNQVSTPAEGAALARIPAMVRDHLHLAAPVIATIRRSTSLGGSLKAGANVIDPSADVTAMFRALATSLMTADLDRLRGVPATKQGTMPIWARRVGDTLVDAAVPAVSPPAPR